jgi:hypothetical protein
MTIPKKLKLDITFFAGSNDCVVVPVAHQEMQIRNKTLQSYLTKVA